MSIRSKQWALALGLVAVGIVLWGSEPMRSGCDLGGRSSQLLATRHPAQNRTSDFFQRSASQSSRKANCSAPKTYYAPPPR